jgi:hypothetical protein
MKKLMGLSFLALGLLVMANRADAASPARGAKGSTSILYTTTVSTISLNPAVLYSVICSSPTTAGDYVVLFDSSTSIGISSGMATSPLKTKIILSSSTSASNAGKIDYDPPLQFSKGIIAVLSAATNSCMFVWESGHVTQGY